MTRRKVFYVWYSRESPFLSFIEDPFLLSSFYNFAVVLEKDVSEDVYKKILKMWVR